MTNKEIMAAYRYAYKMAGDARNGEAPAMAPTLRAVQKASGPAAGTARDMRLRQ